MECDARGNAATAGAASPDPILAVRDLVVRLRTDPSVVLVDHVSFDLDVGQALGVVGETGSGKSLTALAAVGLLSPALEATGEVLFDGRNLLETPEPELRRLRGAEIGMVFQDPNEALNPVFPVGKQIVFALRAHRPSASKSALRKEVVELFDMVGIPQPAQRFSQYPFELSGGLRQRVMIAMALASRPRVLIADEPTTSLDVSIQAEILELLSTLRKESDLALWLITHDLGVVASQCDRVVAMYAGQAVEQGAVDDFTGRPAHPYTAALLSCVPDMSELGVLRRGLPGSPPVAGSYDAGCRFRQRCAYAEPQCADEQTLSPVNLPRVAPAVVRCWKHASLHLDDLTAVGHE